jgi:tetratricopeptide (TPR) repeat protein
MASTIFINYRRDDSTSFAGRLHDRLAQAFGHKNIFMDVDHISAGVDFVAHLNRQVSACKILLVVMGANWLNAKDEAGQLRLHQPDDFVAIEIAAALVRDIRVIPVLVDGAKMPKVSELPETLKLLARRQAVEVRQQHFGRDAEALVERIREALGGPVTLRGGRSKAWAGAAMAAALLIVGWSGYALQQKSQTTELAAQQRETDRKSDEERKATVAAEADAKRRSDDAEQQRLAAQRADEERRATTAAEAEAKRRSADAEQQRLAAQRADEERKARATAEADAKRRSDEAEQQRLAAQRAEEERKAKAAAEAEARRRSDEAEQQHLPAPRGDEERKRAAAETRARDLMKDAWAKLEKKAYDEAVAIFGEVVRLTPTLAAAFGDRGLAYGRRGVAYGNNGDFDRAIADLNQAIRLNPDNARYFNRRGFAYTRKADHARAMADYNEAIRLDPKLALAFTNRGGTFATKGDVHRALSDYTEAIRLDPNDARAFCGRGKLKLHMRDVGGRADIAKAQRLSASDCQ